jgi:hypothetical protein
LILLGLVAKHTLDWGVMVINSKKEAGHGKIVRFEKGEKSIHIALEVEAA